MAMFASTSGDRLAGSWSRMASPGNNGAAGAREAAGVCAAEREQGKPNPCNSFPALAVSWLLTSPRPGSEWEGAAESQG